MKMLRWAWVALFVGLALSVHAGLVGAQSTRREDAAKSVALDQGDVNRRAETGKKKTPFAELEDIDGKPRRPLDDRDQKAAVILFVLQDCPISNAYAPQIQRLADQFSKKDIEFYLVHVDPALSAKEAKQHAQDYRYKLPIVVDHKHEWVKRLKATTAPEAFIVGRDHEVLYRGRIDDRYAALGKPRQQVQREDLRLALEAILAGKRIEVAETKAIGCYIPDVEEKGGN